MDKLRYISKDFSEYIGCSRVIFCLLVVCIHARMLNDIPMDVNNGVICYIKAISFGIASIAVPIFMMFSGYLLGFKYLRDGCSFYNYWRNLRKKAKSLLLPYIVWNFICLGFLLAKHYLNPSTSLPTLWEAFYGYSTGNGKLLTPADGPLWFVRDLIIFNVLSPVFYVVIHAMRRWGLIILTMAYALSELVNGIPGGVLPFMLGWSLVYHDTSIMLVKKYCLVYITTIICFVLVSSPWVNDNWFSYSNQLLMPIFCILCAWTLFLIFRQMQPRYKQMINGLAVYSFFIYASHGIYARMMTKEISLLLYRMHLNYSVSLFVAYSITPIIIVLLSILICKILYKHAHPIYVMLSGGR